MTAMTSLPDRHTAPPAILKAADAAWARYQSTCVLGGTLEERRWAFDHAIRAEDAVIRDRWARMPRTW